MSNSNMTREVKRIGTPGHIITNVDQRTLSNFCMVLEHLFDKEHQSEVSIKELKRRLEFFEQSNDPEE